MIRSFASQRSSINQSINRTLNQSLHARSLHNQSLYQSTRHKSFKPFIKQSSNQSISLLSIRNFSSKPNVDTARSAVTTDLSIDPSVAESVDPSLAQSIGQSIDPSLLDNPLTHAPVYSHTFSQAWEAASSIAYAPTNDHYLPTQTVEFLLDFTHLYTGLPWWATLVVVTLGARGMMFPFAWFQAKHSARLQMIQPEISQLQAVMAAKRASPQGSSSEDQKNYSRAVKEVMARHQTNPLYALLAPIATMPIFISFFAGIQAMHEIHPSFTAGGFHHIMDLSMADPYYILPVLSSITLLLPQELLGNTEMQQSAFKKMKWAFRGFAVLMIPLAGHLPSGLFIYWITSNLWTFVQTAILKLNPVRRVLNLPLMGPNNRPLPLHGSQPVTKTADVPVQIVDMKSGKIIQQITQRVDHMKNNTKNKK